MKQIGETIWVNGGRGSFGISLFEREGKMEVRGAPVDGFNLEVDMQAIKDWGGTVPIPSLKRMLENIEKGGK